MLFFVICFSVFTILFATANFLILYIIGIIWLMWLIIYIYLSKSNKIYIFYYLLSMLIPMMSVYIYHLTNLHDYPDHISNTGTISAITWPDRYIITINNQDRVAKYPSQDWQIWDQIYILAKIQIKSEYIYNIHNMQFDPAGSYILWWEFDYSKWMYMKWYAWSLSIITSKNLYQTTDSIIYKIRNQISHTIQSVFQKKNTIWLILWLIVWNRSMIDKDTNTDFINSWLVHILAVSGGNIVMLIMFLSFVLFWLPYYVRMWVIAIWVIIYGVICGWDSSVIRAVIMALIGIISIFAGRAVDTWRIIAVTYIIMLIVNPYMLTYDMWFLLSFSAICGLVLFDFREYMHSRRRYPIKEYIAPSIAANLGVLPVLILASGQINLLWILANFVVLPILPFVLFGAIILISIFFMNIWFINNLFIYIIDSLTSWIFYVSDWVAIHGLYIYFDTAISKIIIVLFCISWWIYIYKYLASKLEYT